MDMDRDRSRASHTPPHVLIIGGGIGGLCLAQGLHRSGISVAVYERDRSTRFKDQGYRIGIKRDGSHALRDCLPPNLYGLCVATAIRSATRMVFLDHALNEKFSKPIPPPAEDTFGVNRLTLREILLAGLESVVHFGRTFERFDQRDDGRVTAWFADGTSATGDLLVGADGTGSAVRRVLVPDAEFDDIGAFVYGRTPIEPGTLERLPEPLVDSFNRVTAPDGVAMSVATCRKRELLAAAARLAPGLRLTEVHDYLAWMLDGGSERPWLGEAEAAGADGRALHRLARGMLEGWPAPVRRMVDEADAAATFLVHLRSARPVRRWRAADVTLLGDAIHTMSPGRGEGANTALRDAELLRRALVEVAAGRAPLAAAKERYEAEMLRYGFQAVANSLHRPFAPRGGPRAAPAGRADRS
jgi:2-polyprenyl-6-methoxyphenol hydroxylase-like FAD-dependent oxidoreductase